MKQVEEVQHRVFVAHSRTANCQVLDDGGTRLPVNVVAIRHAVFEKTDDRVQVMCRFFTDVFKQERQRFKTTVSDIELGRSVLVEDGRDTSERLTDLGDDGCDS